uniref:D-aspartate oxidase n=1 Tax=Callithrix jacchus TaxID=9483 RepID=A0A8I3WLE2_CALJA
MGTRPAKLWETSFGARDFGGFQDCFFRDRPMDTAQIAVVGAGVAGLSTAVCISKLVPRCSVTIVSDKFTPDTTSDVAAGMLIPHTYSVLTASWLSMAAVILALWEAEAGGSLEARSWRPAWATWQDLISTKIQKLASWQIFQSTPTEEVPFWADVVLGFRKMTEAELKKFPQHVFGQAFTTLKCECPAYLPWLEKRIKGSGGWTVTRRIEDLWELHPSFDVVVNCSGLGSRELAGDSKIFPVRGQVLQVQAPWVEHFIRDGSGLTYIYPGTSHVTLGGTRQKGDWNLFPDAENSREILSRCCALEPSLHGACNIREKVGLRPYRPGVRLQTELLVRDGQRLPVVHHYGHGSGGISVHWGTALEAARLVSECVHALRTPTPKSQL